MYYLNDGVFGTFNGILYEDIYLRGKPLFVIIYPIFIIKIFQKSMSRRNSLQENPEEFPTTVWGPTCDGHDLIEVKKMIDYLPGPGTQEEGKKFRVG